MKRARSSGSIALVSIPLLVATACAGNSVAFGTATKFGLDITQRADQTVDVTLGYDRAELAVIPAPDSEDAGANEDTYSVLGYFTVRYGNPWTGGPLVLRQFFSTGWAARKASSNPKLQEYFAEKAAQVQKKEEGE